MAFRRKEQEQPVDLSHKLIGLNGIEIEFTDDDLRQLKNQSEGMGVPYAQYVKEFIENAISMELCGNYKHVRW